MRACGIWSCFVVFLVGFFILAGNYSFAQGHGPSAALIGGAYRQILAGADKNGDGKLSMEECLSISKNKEKAEKDCKCWDANGDGVITEDEYVEQVKKIMR